MRRVRVAEACQLVSAAQAREQLGCSRRRARRAHERELARGNRHRPMLEPPLFDESRRELLAPRIDRSRKARPPGMSPTCAASPQVDMGAASMPRQLPQSGAVDEHAAEVEQQHFGNRHVAPLHAESCANPGHWRIPQRPGATTYGTSSTCPQLGWLLQGILVDLPPPTLTRFDTIRIPPSPASAERAGLYLEPVVLNSEDAPGHVGSGIQHTQSGRFIRVYLLTWGLLAAGGLTYLASARVAVDLQPAAATAAGRPSQSSTRAGTARGQQGAGRDRQCAAHRDRDAEGPRPPEGDRSASATRRTRTSQSRLAALEERVSTLATPPPPPVAVITVPSAEAKGGRQGESGRREASLRAARHLAHRLRRRDAEAGTAGAAEPRSLPSSRPAASRCSASRHHVRRARGDAGAADLRRAARRRAVARCSAHELDRAARPARRRARLAAAALRGAAQRQRRPTVWSPGRCTSKAEADKVCADMGLGRRRLPRHHRARPPPAA